MMMMMKKKKGLVLLLSLFLLSICVCLSFVKPSVAVPTTRSLINPAWNPSSSPSALVQRGFPAQAGASATSVIKSRDDHDEEEDVIEGRMVVESMDYPGTGANNHHDPKPPGSGRS